MANPEITNNDRTQIEVFNPLYEDAVIKFPSALTYAKGVIMARALIVIGAVTPGTNTGNGTVTTLALASGGPALIGDYNLECVTAVTNGGVFKLEDPNGNILIQDITILAGAGGVIEFIGFGLTFLITDGSTDFIVGDSFALTVTEVNQMVPYLEGGLDGSGIASAILPIALTSTGAATPDSRIIISGEMSENQISVNAGGDIPLEAREQLKSVGIILRASALLDIYDNA